MHKNAGKEMFFSAIEQIFMEINLVRQLKLSVKGLRIIRCLFWRLEWGTQASFSKPLRKDFCLLL